MVIYDKTFDSEDEAELWLEKRVEKRDSGAVKVTGFPAPKASDQKKIDVISLKIRELDQELQAFPAEIIKRVRAAKSKTRGCDCGSQIAVNRIQSLACPVCGVDFLTTDTDKGRIEAMKVKRSKANAELVALKGSVDGRATKNGWRWLVGWLAAE